MSDTNIDRLASRFRHYFCPEDLTFMPEKAVADFLYLNFTNNLLFATPMVGLPRIRPRWFASPQR